ncbi:MAG: site-2 protease family protein [Massilia sp.]
MIAMLTLLVAIYAAMLVHLLTMALTGRMIGAKIRTLSIGLGPVIFQGKTLRVGAIPTGGYVQFLTSAQDDLAPAEMRSALDRKSSLAQLAVTLSGCALLLVMSVCAGGSTGLDAFLSLPRQLIVGACSPFGEAQALIRHTLRFLQSAPYWLIASAVCAKFAALNLIPFPWTNGGAALAVLGRRTGIAKWWSPTLTHLANSLGLVLLLAWCLAMLDYANRT